MARWVLKLSLLIFLLTAFESAGWGEPATSVQSGRIPLNERENVAVAASLSGTVVSKDLRRYQLEAIPGGTDQHGCMPVKVKVLLPQWEETYEYRICNGLILEEIAMPHEVDSGRDLDLEDVVGEIARKARDYGLAQAVFGNITVKGASLSQGEQCTIEISIFKDKQLTQKRHLPCK